MPIHDLECVKCGFVEERFIRGKMSEYDPGICPNGCVEPMTFHLGVEGYEPVKLTVKFNAGNMAKPIFRGYGYHCTDYDAYKAK